jgi:hypothetical protein
MRSTQTAASLIMALLVPVVVIAQGTHATQPGRLPGYTRTLQLNATPDTSANVSIGDLNGDGKLDILLVNGRHWGGRSMVMLGDGHGHFPTVYPLTPDRHRSYSGRVVDLDGDGHLDVVLSNDSPDPKLIYLNDGAGHFRAGGKFGQPEWETRNAGIADLNRDGMPDIVVANRAGNAIAYVCLNQGGGRFTADCAGFAHISATTITPGDINGDQRIDLVVPHRDGGQSYVYLNNGNGEFADAKTIPFGPPNATIRIAEVADFDRDGRLDIVVIDDEHRQVGVYFGQRDGFFSAALPLNNGKATPYALAVADLNQDGATDILVGTSRLRRSSSSTMGRGAGTRRSSSATTRGRSTASRWPTSTATACRTLLQPARRRRVWSISASCRLPRKRARHHGPEESAVRLGCRLTSA